jgi:hypothetical protein
MPSTTASSGRPAPTEGGGGGTTVGSSRVSTVATNVTSQSNRGGNSKTYDVAIVRDRYILFDFSDPRAPFAAARMTELGAKIITSFPDDYGSAMCKITIWFMVYSNSPASRMSTVGENSSSSIAAKTSGSSPNAEPAKPLPKQLSRRSKLLLKAASETPHEEITPVQSGAEMADIARSHGIKVLNYHTLDKLLTKLGQEPLELGFSLSETTHEPPNRKRIRISDRYGFYTGIEKVYTEKNSRLSVDEPPPAFLPAQRKRKREASKETTEAQPVAVAVAATPPAPTPTPAPQVAIQAKPPPAQVEGQVAGQPKEKRQKVARDTMYCEVCGQKFSSIEEHIVTDLHVKLQARSPVWEVLDDLYERVEDFQPGDSNDDRTYIISQILFRCSETAIPMAYSFGSRLLCKDDEEDQVEDDDY